MMKQKVMRIAGMLMIAATLLIIPVTPVTALSGVAVTLSSTGTSDLFGYAGEYIIFATLGMQLTGDGDAITVTFPVGTVVPENLTGVTVVATLGAINGTPNIAAILNRYTVSGNPGKCTVTLTLGPGDLIGEAAQIRIYIPVSAGVINPKIAGDYTLTLKTTKEATPITSNTYTVMGLLAPGGPPPMVTVYNAEGVRIFQDTNYNALYDGVSKVTGDHWTIKISNGAHSDETVIIPARVKNLLITNEADNWANTVVADWVVDGSGVTFHNLILAPGVENHGIIVNAPGVKFYGCTFIKTGTAGTTPVQTLLTFNNNIPGTQCTIDNCTFDTSLGGVKDIGILVNTSAAGLEITGCKFITDYSEPPDAHPWKEDDAIVVNSGCTIRGNEFSGSGHGINVAAGEVIIANNTFTGVHEVLRITRERPSSVTFESNTVDKCGIRIAAWPPNGTNTIELDPGVGSMTTLVNNKFSGTGNY
ncbi:MAG: hypothetical protein PHE50_10490, partial [Dehalococcoidales bacterium]|nr:hypothetical protein [Dehalococcoidales bacterium]